MNLPLLGASLAVAVLTFTDTTIAQDRAPRSSDSIVGNWNAPACISAGKIARWNHEFLIEETSLILRRRGGGTEGETWTYTVDSSKKPKQLTMIKLGLPDHQTGKPQKINAIYEQTDKEIRVAWLPGKNGSSLEERPTDMTSTAENRAIVFVLTPQQ